MAKNAGPMIPYTPDKNKNKGGNGAGQNNFTRLPAFQPGQRGLLADQLNTGFGGGENQWRGLLGGWTDPMRMNNGFNYGNGGGLGGGGGKKQEPLSAEDKAMADIWIAHGGPGVTVNPKVFGTFSQLSPQAQAYVQSEIAAREARGRK